MNPSNHTTEKHTQIIVIGGGSAGIISAISAARNGARVTLLERMPRIGKKILATGNGRCNFTNLNLGIEHYHGSNPLFVKAALKNFDLKMTLRFFEELGILYKVEEQGKVFPRSDQASSILDVLRLELNRLSVETLCDIEVKTIAKRNDHFTVFSKKHDPFKAFRIILATGGKAAPNLGSNGSGFELSQGLGHHLIPPFPSLTKLRINSADLKYLSGVKFNGCASITDEKCVLATEKGEILFTDYGISGLPILQLSRKAAEVLIKKKPAWITLDLFPDLSEEQLEDLLQKRFKTLLSKNIETAMIGLLNKKLSPIILKMSHVNDFEKPSHSINQNQIKSIVRSLKKWTFEIMGTESWMEAQVTAGGISTNDIHPDTLESKLVKGLFFAGEIIDIDGDSGGYNLQWAWSSGFLAGFHASKS